MAAANEERGVDGGESSCQTNGARRRRPLHSSCRTASISLLLASTSLHLASASERRRHGRGGDGGGTNLRRGSHPHSASNNNNDGADRRLQNRQRQKNKNNKSNPSKSCPDGYTGKVPTNRCSGYVTCSEGIASGTGAQECAGGTLFDVKSGMCTWPDKVDCKTGSELLQQLGLDDEGNEIEEEEEVKPSKFCPERFTGRAPTSNCNGYVDCKGGKEMISARCPPRTKFDYSTGLCSYTVKSDECEMLVGDDPSDSPYVGVNENDKYCPKDYSGRAPMGGCDGYVDCKNGEARRSKMCPGDSKFDVMILACTYAKLGGCEALDALEPTESPITRAQHVAESLVQGCPEGLTGYQVLPGCESYLWCVDGEEQNKIDCPANTLFNGQFCTWGDQVDCDTTMIPTLAPTAEPTLTPSGEPTWSPTELDMADSSAIYYPNFSDGVCRNDGNFPQSVGRHYLFTNSQNCCETYFMENMEACVRASIPTPPPTPAGGREWYPDYVQGTCKNKNMEMHGRWETNLFWTYEECCAFDWIADTVKCLRNKPTIAYYPDYTHDACLNDGKQSPFEMNLFGSLEECCRFKWIDYGLCITGGTDKSGEEKVTTPAPAPDMGYEYYPDQEHNVCHCDGRKPDWQPNVYSSYSACCDFSLINTATCMEYRSFQEEKCVIPRSASYNPDAIWYPDSRVGMCRDDGNAPRDANVQMSVSASQCCKRFMPGSRKACTTTSEANSKSGTLPTPPTPPSPPTPPTPPSPTPASPTPATSPHCSPLGRKKCDADPQCWYDRDVNKCYKSLVPTPPNPRPPTPAAPTPGVGPTSANGGYCKNFLRKDCVKNDKCAWDHQGKSCDMVPARSPTPPPVPPRDAGSGDDCADNFQSRGICRNQPQCGWDNQGKRCYTKLQAGGSHADTDGQGDVNHRNPYYPDYFHSVCLNDGHHTVDDETYDNVVDCCGNAWLDYDTCMDDRDSLVRWPKPANPNAGRPYYPDYFYGVCKNDGMQSPAEEDLFDELEGCCELDYMDYDSCMSNAQS